MHGTMSRGVNETSTSTTVCTSGATMKLPLPTSAANYQNTAFGKEKKRRKHKTKFSY